MVTSGNSIGEGIVRLTLGDYYWEESTDITTSKGLPTDSAVEDLTYVSSTELSVADSVYVSRGWSSDVALRSFYGVHNMYDTEASIWKGPFKAGPLGYSLKGIPRGTPVIAIKPKQNLLCHTKEYIFILKDDILRVTGLLTNNLLQVIPCYNSSRGRGRITFVISNLSWNRTTLLVPGKNIIQVELATKYYDTEKVEKVEDSKDWNPEDMLPRLYLDDEVK